MKWTQIALVAAAALTLAAAPVRAEDDDGTLALEAGTVRAGGAVSLTTLVAFRSGSSDSTTGFVLGVSPSVGYFLADHLELRVALSLSVPFGDLFDGAVHSVGGSLGGRYHVPLGGKLSLYAGLDLGGSHSWADQLFLSFKQSRFTVGVPLGFLVALHKHVAVDAGVRVNVNMLFDGDGSGAGTELSLPIGWFGIEAFF